MIIGQAHRQKLKTSQKKENKYQAGATARYYIGVISYQVQCILQFTVYITRVVQFISHLYYISFTYTQVYTLACIASLDPNA